MKKYLLFLFGVLFVFNAYGEGVVLSDTSISEDSDVVDEEPFVAPQTTNNYPENRTNNYVSQQIKPAAKTLLSNDTSDPLFLVGDNMFLSDTYIAHVDRKLRVGQFIGYGINNKEP